MICRHQNQCNGCSKLELPLDAQRTNKIQQLQEAAGVPVELVDGPALHFRDRTDLTLTEGRLGFYDKSRDIFRLEKCEIYSPELQSFYDDFARDLPAIKKGSLRLRTGLNNERGLWLDFANTDIKSLLDDGKWLHSLLEKNIEIEIGQKKKRLETTPEGLKLKNPKMKPWFSTIEGEKEIPLQCFVSSFTQPSRRWNAIMMKVFLKNLPAQKLKWLEVGSGIGNFTRALLHRGDTVVAVENDAYAVEALRENTKDYGPEIHAHDYQRINLGQSYDAILCDPPRSGLGRLTDAILDKPPQFLFYVSCDLDSWKRDMGNLDSGLGKKFRLDKLLLIDQFPHTPRAELLSVFQLR